MGPNNSYIRCEICGDRNDIRWLQHDFRTKWLKRGACCGFMHCEGCTEAANEVFKHRIAKAVAFTEKREIECIKDPSGYGISWLRYSYLFVHDGSQEMRDWVVSHVGADRARELLDFSCDHCGKFCIPQWMLGEEPQIVDLHQERFQKEKSRLNSCPPRDYWENYRAIEDTFRKNYHNFSYFCSKRCLQEASEQDFADSH